MIPKIQMNEMLLNFVRAQSLWRLKPNDGKATPCGVLNMKPKKK